MTRYKLCGCFQVSIILPAINGGKVMHNLGSAKSCKVEQDIIFMDLLHLLVVYSDLDLTSITSTVPMQRRNRG